MYLLLMANPADYQKKYMPFLSSITKVRNNIVRVMGIMFVNSISRDGWGGGEKWMVEAASGLAERGHRVYFGLHKNSILEKNAVEKGISTIHLNIHSDFDPFESFRISRILRKYDIDVLICNFNKDVRVAGLGAKFAGTPVVLARHGILLCGKKSRHKFFLKNFTDGIITNTNSIKKAYSEYGWWDNDFVKVIYNGIRTDREIDEYSFLEEYPLAEGKKIIVSCGRLSQQKDFKMLIPLAKRAKKLKKKWIFFLIGNGELEAELKEEILREKLENMLIMTGFRTDTLKMLKAADLLFHPALFEGMPNVVMEAMLCKTAVIATDVNGTSELVENEVSGRIVQPGNLEEMWKNLELLMENDNLRDQTASEGKKRVVSSFNRELMITNLENFFEDKLMSKRKK